jgi:ABC-type nickel/cobalt efflux system permease component RcnA
MSLPGWAREAITRVVGVQRSLNAALSEQVRAIRSGAGTLPAAMLFLFSFLYGVFHALGPGHGKIVTTAYLATRNARLGHALLMSGANALAQSLTAIVLVGAFAVALDLGGMWILGKTLLLEQFSYGMIAAVGAWIAFAGVRGQAHSHGGTGAPPNQPSRRELLSMAVAVGIRPCTGAILVLLFTLASGVFWAGILATLIMGAGVALTLAVMGVATVGVRMAATAWIPEHSLLARAGGRALQIAAGLLLLATGLLLLWAALERGSLGG